MKHDTVHADGRHGKHWRDNCPRCERALVSRFYWAPMVCDECWAAESEQHPIRVRQVALELVESLTTAEQEAVVCFADGLRALREEAS